MKGPANSIDVADVVVIGGGPAGAAAATFLQREGHRCVVLERATFPRYHIGESLIPHTFGTLDRLGLLPVLRASEFPVKRSVRFVSPSGDASERFYFSETIPGEQARTWQVERSQFDHICLENARNSGVDVRTQTTVEQVLFDNGRATGVRIKSENGTSRDLHASVVVDASGHATVIGSQLGLTSPVSALKKASVWAYYQGGERSEGIDAGETTIYMIPQRGWFWHIPLPDDIVSVGLVASPDYLFSETGKFEEVLSREVKRCAPLAARLSRAVRTGPVRGTRRLAYRNRQVVGDGWVMIGDAAAFLDPIYSSGLFLAMASAELAAACIHEALDAQDLSRERLGKFTKPLAEGVEVIYRLIQAFYDPNFSFKDFTKRFPEQRPALINCLTGDVIQKDLSGFTAALAQMTPPPPPLSAPAASGQTR